MGCSGSRAIHPQTTRHPTRQPQSPQSQGYPNKSSYYAGQTKSTATQQPPSPPSLPIHPFYQVPFVVQELYHRPPSPLQLHRPPSPPSSAFHHCHRSPSPPSCYHRPQSPPSCYQDTSSYTAPSCGNE
jgi:hypothetical protein